MTTETLQVLFQDASGRRAEIAVPAGTIELRFSDRLFIPISHAGMVNHGHTYDGQQVAVFVPPAQCRRCTLKHR